MEEKNLNKNVGRIYCFNAYQSVILEDTRDLSYYSHLSDILEDTRDLSYYSHLSDILEDTRDLSYYSHLSDILQDITTAEWNCTFWPEILHRGGVQILPHFSFTFLEETKTLLKMDVHTHAPVEVQKLN